MPLVLSQANPRRIRLSINFLAERSGKKINRQFRATVLDGESFEFETGDADQAEETRLNVTARVTSSKSEGPGKANVKVDVK